MSTFDHIYQHLLSVASSPKVAIPGIWVNEKPNKIISTEYHQFLLQQFDLITENLNKETVNLNPLSETTSGETNWTKNATT